MKPEKSKLSIIKIGGNVIDNPADLDQFLFDFSNTDTNKILVHGGGKSATKMAQDSGLLPQIIDGRRVTDQPMLNIVVMVYAGGINKNIVAKLQALEVNAMGFSGADGNLICSSKRNHPIIDYGFVGDIQKVNTPLLEILIHNKITPVFSAITHDKKGQLLNTNADTIASELAIALSEIFDITLYYCFEKKGVLANIEEENSVIESIDMKLYEKLKLEKKIHSGMIPKLDNCFGSLSKGVQNIRIGHYTMLRNKENTGTTIKL